MCRLNYAILALLITTCAFAKEPATAPTTQKTAAESTNSRTIDDAKARYDAALRTARAQYLRDLNDLKKRAMKAENLSEANSLNDAIAQVEREQRSKSGPSKSARINHAEIQARDDWQRTIPVKKGDLLAITATGQWCTNDRIPAEATYGPDGLHADGTAEVHGQWSVLIARIGFKVYLVGNETQIVAPQEGFLEFRSNDFSLGDNNGAINVTIAKDPAEGK